MALRRHRLASRWSLIMAALIGCWMGDVGLCPGRDVFVNNEVGDDAFFGRVATPGSTVDGPVRSITRAIELAQPGDRIVLAPTKTPYRESITLAGQRLSQGILQDLILDGNGAVMDGSAPIPVEAWELDRHSWQRWGRTVYRFTPEQRSHQQLFLGDRPAKRVFVDKSAEVPPKLEPLEWCLFEGKIYFCVEPDHRPENYPLRYAKLTVGITLHHVHGVTIRDLTIQGYQLDGISLANTARDIRLQRVVLRGNGRAGLSVGGACRADLVDSLLGDNGAAQILTFPYSELHVFNSQVLGNTAPAWVDKGGRLFVDGQEKEGSLDVIEPPSSSNTSNP
ncbi:right-handed parallel beta-helix repeat-containing protein [Thermogutta sp.]|uniref:right-handed parallel beta-helix repeat-containing protein n=1 Tax=Thermogutta sp. TaxID=1962930 RepID=UPI00321F779B